MLVAEARQLGTVAEAHQLRALGKYISKVYPSNHLILSGTLLQGYSLMLNVWWCLSGMKEKNTTLNESLMYPTMHLSMLCVMPQPHWTIVGQGGGPGFD